MKKLTRWMIILFVVFTTLGITGTANAQESAKQGFRGEVTAVGSSSLTINTPNGKTLTINVTDQTRIQLPLERIEGGFEDIEVGNFVGGRGQSVDDDSINARLILVLPQPLRDMPRLRGRLTAIEGSTLIIENRDGSQRVDTNETTHFRKKGQEISLEDLIIGNLVIVLGQKQDDKPFLAQIVMVATGAQIRKHTLRGDVLSVNVEASVLTVEAKGQKEGIWTVNTTAETKYRIPGIENPTLEDIPVGAHVGIVGQQSEDGSNSGTARTIVVVPEHFRDSIRVFGQVTNINGTTFTIESPRGTLTILTNEDTQYRTRDDRDVSFEDIKVGGGVMVVGKPVTDQQNTIQAQIVGLPRNP